MSESDDEPGTCYRWSRNFVVAHAILATGFITAPVAVLHLLRRPHTGAATFFAMFSFFCAAISAVLCCRFYAELKRPPWPRWLSAATASAVRVRQQDGGGDEASASRDNMSHDLRHPELPVRVRLEMQAALAAGRVSSYEHRGGAAAEDCAVCLGEVEKGGTVRRLPACHHVLHRECIDVWLSAHATCPVCRGGVLPDRPPEVVVSVGAVHVQAGLVIPAQGHVFPGQSDPISGCGLGRCHA
ncbi:unnamed protein product [Urochloa humidicola]